MKLQISQTRECFFKSGTAETMLWNLSSDAIGVYLWFLKFSNVLLKLVQ